MKNILVPLGTAPDAHDVLQYAVEFAADFGAKVYIVDVFSAGTGAGTLANVKTKIAENKVQQLREILAKVDTKGVKISIAAYSGDMLDGIQELNRSLSIDLVILRPRSNDVNEALYLGPTTGSIIKQTNISALVVPHGATYSRFKTILTAFKSGVLNNERALTPLKSIMSHHGSETHLLLVKTPGHSEEDLEINPALGSLSEEPIVTENATTYLGVLEHFQKHSPDLLCVFRRRRGFFKKLWEKNTIAKSEFYVPVPVLVLRVKKD